MPILLLLNWVYRHVGNYGVAIILLTVVSKILFYPLTVKSMRSMKAMQALQPQINALRNKHKSDPQRLQRETMELYREHKVNPMGGCLPMIAQVPIFYALYLTLQYSVELQGAPFVLWITDLSKKDPYYVLPILMGASMLVQQKMIDEKAAVLQRFTPVTTKAWDYIIDNHLDEAVDAVIKQRPNEKLDPAVIKAQIQLYLPLFATPATKGKPMGWQAEEDWAAALKAMEDAAVIKPGSKPSDYYTNRFIPG